jgi:hypothetical protein
MISGAQYALITKGTSHRVRQVCCVESPLAYASPHCSVGMRLQDLVAEALVPTQSKILLSTPDSFGISVNTLLGRRHEIKELPRYLRQS